MKQVLLILSFASGLCGCFSAPQPVDNEELKSEENPDRTRKIMRIRNGLLNGRSLVLYPNGTIAAILYFKNDTLHGIQRWYHANGVIKEIQQVRLNDTYGKWHKFYEHAGIQSIREIKDGKRIGNYYEFYKHPKNKLKIKANFALVNNKEWDNGYIEYDTLGKIISAKSFLLLNSSDDTVRVGEILTLKLAIVGPQEKGVLARINGYNANFQLINPEKEKVIIGSNHQVVLRIRPHQTGPDTIRGYVADYKVVDIPGQGKQNKERPIYFAYPYYVR